MTNTLKQYQLYENFKISESMINDPFLLFLREYHPQFGMSCNATSKRITMVYTVITTIDEITLILLKFPFISTVNR